MWHMYDGDVIVVPVVAVIVHNVPAKKFYIVVKQLNKIISFFNYFNHNTHTD